MELRGTHTSTVTPEQIDHLGHMNVRYYAANAGAGTRAFLTGLGIDEATAPTADDVYTRHHHEQMLGSSLEVRSAAVEIEDGRLGLYHELRNVETDVLAATFVHRLDLPADGTDWDGLLSPTLIAIPAHGAPRSIDLHASDIAAKVGVDELRSRGLAMRKPRVVPEPIDGNLAQNPELIWGGEPVDDREFVLLHDGPDGEVMGWATMESRIRTYRRPEVGDRIQSFSATVALGNKTSQQMHWLFDIDRDELLFTFEVVNLAFDTVARRSMVVPDAMRESMERTLHPDLAPGADQSGR